MAEDAPLRPCVVALLSQSLKESLRQRCHLQSSQGARSPALGGAVLSQTTCRCKLENCPTEMPFQASCALLD